MIRLARGEDSLIVAPEHGGAIVGWTRNGTHLLRRPSPAAVLHGQPGAMGCFPLVPFCNRIAYRGFAWGGRTYELAANFGDHPHAIHGVGWQRPWTVEAASTDTVTLSMCHDPSGDSPSGDSPSGDSPSGDSPSGDSARAWPFAFTARLIYRLTEQGLTMRIEATNDHSASAPMGLGTHPWFPRGPDATIAFQADGVWNNRDALPGTHGPVPPGWSHSAGRAADREPLDNCFTGWHGTAQIPGAQIPGIRIEADPMFANLQVYTPAGADFFCVEPVSHVPDAINRPELPAAQSMTILTPGQSLGGSIIFVRGDHTQVPHAPVIRSEGS